MQPRFVAGLALVAAVSNPCAGGVLSVGAQNPAEYLRPGEAYLAQCYLIDPAEGSCATLLQKELPAQPASAARQVKLVAQGGRLLVPPIDYEKGAPWCEFKTEAGCSYEELRGNVVVVVSKAESLNPAGARPIADACKEDVAIGTGQRASLALRLGRRMDAPAEIGVPNPLP